MSLFDKFRNRNQKRGEFTPPEAEVKKVTEEVPAETDYTQAWIDTVNTGSRFRIDFNATVHDADGMPYTLVHPVDANATNTHSTFRSVALCLADNGSGAVLCNSDWDPNADDPNNLILPLGPLVEFLMVGRLELEPKSSDGWGITTDHGMGTYTEPDTLLLPLQCRRIINTAMQISGVEEPLLALYTNQFGEKSLHFSGWSALVADGAMQPVHTLWGILTRCVPRHYVIVMDEPSGSAQARRQRWGLWPSGALEAPLEFHP